MIYLDKDSQNTLRVVLKDINTPYPLVEYTWYMTNIQSGTTYSFICEDMVPNQPFYSTFTIDCFTQSGVNMTDAPIGHYDLIVSGTASNDELRVVLNDILIIKGEEPADPETNTIDNTYKINVIE